MGLGEAGGWAGLVGWSAGWGPVVGRRGILPHRFTGERWPSVFAHATGHSVFKGTAGATEGVEAERGQEKKKEGRVCWPHVTVCALPCLLVAGCHAERQSQGLKVKPVQMCGGVTAVEESLGNCPLHPAPGATRRP